MMSTDPERRAKAFEDWYSDILTPLEQHPLFSEEFESMAEYFQAPEGNKLLVDSEFVALAYNRDIQGLLRASESPTAVHAIEEAKLGRRPEITYCVAHMLVDGSGNEDFANEWIANHAPSGRSCAAAVHTLCAVKNSMHKIEVQHLLGLATLQDFFQQPKPDPSGKKERGFWNTAITELCDKDHDAEQVALRANILAAVLRQQHPSKPPLIDYLDSGSWHVDQDLIDTCWRGPSRYQNLLPAIELAYGHHNPAIEARMKKSISDLITAGQIGTLRSTRSDARWDALTTWGTPEIAKALWHSTVKVDASMPFTATLVGTGGDLARHRCRQLQSIGFDGFDDHVDFSDHVRTKVPEGGMIATTALQQAAELGSLELAGWLLAQGCDPTKRSINTVNPSSEKSSVEFAEESLLSRGSGLSDTLKAAAASRAARLVLAEMSAEPFKGGHP